MPFLDEASDLRDFTSSGDHDAEVAASKAVAPDAVPRDYVVFLYSPPDAIARLIVADTRCDQLQNPAVRKRA